MKKTFKSMLALMLAAVMCFGLVGTAAFAEEISWTDGDGNVSEDLAGDVIMPAAVVQYVNSSPDEAEEQTPEVQEQEDIGSAPLNVSVDAGSYSCEGSVITITPAPGRYVKSITLKDESVIGYAAVKLSSTVVSIDIDDFDDLTEADTLFVTTEAIPEEIEYKGAYAETRSGNFEFDMDLSSFVVSENYDYDEEGNPTAFLGYTVSDALIQDGNGLANKITHSSGITGSYDYQSKNSLYIVFDSGASVAVPLDKDTGIRSISFNPVLPFSVKVVAVVDIPFIIEGEYSTYDDIPSSFDLTNEQGITLKADFDRESGEFENVVVSAQDNELETSEYQLTIKNYFTLTPQSSLTITAPTETKTYNGNECRETNPGPPPLLQGFSVCSPLCLYSDLPVSRTSRDDDPSRCWMSRVTPRPSRAVSPLADAGTEAEGEPRADRDAIA